MSKDFLIEAKDYFETNFTKQISDKKILSQNSFKERFKNLNKKVLWDQAQHCQISVGEAVKVPILYGKEYFIRAGKAQRAMDLYNLSYLMMYKDREQKMHVEWVIAIPDNDYADRKNNNVLFSGVITVKDWNGNLLKAFRILKNGDLYNVTESEGTSENLKVDANIKTNDVTISCYPIYYYTCGSQVGVAGQYCHADGSSIYCNISSSPDQNVQPISSGTGLGGGDGTIPQDYMTANTDCQGRIINGAQPISPSFTDPCGAVLNLNVTRDTSIINSPKMSCILDRLEGNNGAGMDLALTKYDALLQAFKGNDYWNITYKLGYPIDKNGNLVNAQTHAIDNHNFEIIFNRGQIGVNSSVIGQAFIHEAFHAYLNQKAAQTWGTLNPIQWTNDTNDLTLDELFKYIEQTQQKDLNDIEHNFMANNINLMIPVLQQFIDPDNTLNLSYDAYEGLMLQGLQGSNYYRDNIENATETRTYEGEILSLAEYFRRISSKASSPILNCD